MTYVAPKPIGIWLEGYREVYVRASWVREWLGSDDSQWLDVVEQAAMPEPVPLPCAVCHRTPFEECREPDCSRTEAVRRAADDD